MRRGSTLIDRSRGMLLLATLCWLPSALAPVCAADLFNFQVTALTSPECLDDVSDLFFSQNLPPTVPVHPTLPIGSYYMLVRYLGADSVSAPSAYDYGYLPQSYPWPPVRGMALTGLSVPEPVAAWQRADRPDATPDNSSAFQLHCYDAGSFINTWTFPDLPLTGGGAHSIYGYSYYDAQSPLIFDSNPGTDFVVQASVEIPWFAAWADPMAPAGIVPVGEVSLFAYLRDRQSGKTFALLFGIFDNRYGSNPTYASFVSHDGETPFVSMPINSSGKYLTLSPYSSTFTGNVWSGLKFFRAQVSQVKFSQALADMNAYCHAHSTENYCGSSTPAGNAYSPVVTDYEITDFGVLHEVVRGGTNGNLSMGVHIYGLGAWNFR